MRGIRQLFINIWAYVTGAYNPEDAADERVVQWVADPYDTAPASRYQSSGENCNIACSDRGTNWGDTVRAYAKPLFLDGNQAVYVTINPSLGTAFSGLTAATMVVHFDRLNSANETGGCRIGGAGGQWSIQLRASGVTRVEVSAGNYGQFTDTIDAGVHTYHAVYDGGGATNADRLKLYKDGSGTPVTLAFTGTIPTALPNFTAADIWRNNLIGSNFGFGDCYGVAHYTDVLTASEIAEQSNYKNKYHTDNLEACYLMEDANWNGQSTVIHDSSGNGHHGTFGSNYQGMHAFKDVWATKGYWIGMNQGGYKGWRNRAGGANYESIATADINFQTGTKRWFYIEWTAGVFTTNCTVFGKWGSSLKEILLEHASSGDITFSVVDGVGTKTATKTGTGWAAGDSLTALCYIDTTANTIGIDVNNTGTFVTTAISGGVANKAVDFRLGYNEADSRSFDGNIGTFAFGTDPTDSWTALNNNINKKNFLKLESAVITSTGLDAAYTGKYERHSNYYLGTSSNNTVGWRFRDVGTVGPGNFSKTGSINVGITPAQVGSYTVDGSGFELDYAGKCGIGAHASDFPSIQPNASAIYAVTYDGNSDFFNDGTDPLYISFWAKRTETTNNGSLIARYQVGNRGWSIDCRSDNKLRFNLYQDTVTDRIVVDSPVTVEDSWVFYELEYDGSQTAAGVTWRFDRVKQTSSTIEDNLTALITDHGGAVTVLGRGTVGSYELPCNGIRFLDITIKNLYGLGGEKTLYIPGTEGQGEFVHAIHADGTIARCNNHNHYTGVWGQNQDHVFGAYSRGVNNWMYYSGAAGAYNPTTYVPKMDASGGGTVSFHMVWHDFVNGDVCFGSANGAGKDFYVKMQAAAKMEFVFGNSSAVSTSVITREKAHLVELTWDSSGNFSISVDSETPVTGTSTPTTTVRPVYIGCLNNNGTVANNFRGFMRNVEINHTDTGGNVHHRWVLDGTHSHLRASRDYNGTTQSHTDNTGTTAINGATTWVAGVWFMNDTANGSTDVAAATVNSTLNAGNGFRIYTGTAGKQYVEVRDSANAAVHTGNSAITAGAMHCAVVWYDATNDRWGHAFDGGTPSTTARSGQTISTFGQNLGVGEYPNRPNTTCFDGQIFTVALGTAPTITPEQWATDFFNNGFPPRDGVLTEANKTAMGLVHISYGNEKTDYTRFDFSGHGSNLTSYNNPAFLTTTGKLWNTIIDEGDGTAHIYNAFTLDGTPTMVAVGSYDGTVDAFGLPPLWTPAQGILNDVRNNSEIWGGLQSESYARNWNDGDDNKFRFSDTWRNRSETYRAANNWRVTDHYTSALTRYDDILTDISLSEQDAVQDNYIGP